MILNDSFDVTSRLRFGTASSVGKSRVTESFDLPESTEREGTAGLLLNVRH